MKKNTKGITLIALVITIIVLLILAGVSIAMLTGDNGILTQAQNARNRTEEAQDVEKIKLAVSEAQIGENGYEELNQNNLQKALNSQFKERNVVATDNGDGTFTVSVLDKLKDYTISGSGNTIENGLDWNEAMANAVAPETQDEERNKDVIGIGTDGKPVDMDLWEYSLLEDGTIALRDDSLDGYGYKGSIDSNGEIIGKVPQYISTNNGKTYSPVTSIQQCFREQADLKIAPKLPNTVTNMHEAFLNCTNLEQVSNIPNSVTNMESSFINCSKLVSIPSFPINLVKLGWSFRDCNMLENVPTIPDSVSDMAGTFSGCTSLIEIPNLPNNLTTLSNTFYDCSALKKCPDIPSNVTSLNVTFLNCISLEKAPNISNGVESMDRTFLGCTNLTKGPDVIPETVTYFRQTFQECSKLSGEMEINANITETTDTYNYYIPFYAAVKGEAKLKLKGSCPVLNQIVEDANNPNITL